MTMVMTVTTTMTRNRMRTRTRTRTTKMTMTMMRTCCGEHNNQPEDMMTMTMKITTTRYLDVSNCWITVER